MDLDLNMKSAVLLTKVVIGFWRFGFVLDFADMLTTMVIGFGVKFEHCLCLTNLKIWRNLEVQR
jgi:multisubunit Na+/H+ antiporter MnhC subunit